MQDLDACALNGIDVAKERVMTEVATKKTDRVLVVPFDEPSHSRERKGE
jgi:hypothetical protein